MNGNPEMRTPRLGSPTADLSWRSQSRAKPGSDLRLANSITKWRIWDQWDSQHPHPSSASQTHHPWTTAPGTYILPVPSSVLGARASLRSTQEQLHLQWLAQCADTWVLAPPRVASHFSLSKAPSPRLKGKSLSSHLPLSTPFNPLSWSFLPKDYAGNLLKPAHYFSEYYL